ncbi:MAG TPA: polysaccharide biosynthesis tyrosine autokinase [Bryobacteraceae bacterium]|nr:polysaccharide biosynthesis tyrosine autokinase [Bryobacteraceae bacterium]
MSRVHDALRKAATERPEPARPASVRPPLPPPSEAITSETGTSPVAEPSALPAASPVTAAVDSASAPHGGMPIPHPAIAIAELEKLEDLIRQAPAFPFAPASDALLVNPAKPREAPAEEFRSLRTRLNHLQSSQPLHTLVVSSASPGEGKSFTACNLAMSQAQLAGKRILLADFDFRRPSIDRIFGLKGKPGLTDYLLGKVGAGQIIHRLEGTNLFIIPAGESVANPLELLNLTECNTLLQALRDHFDWVIIDSPPLLFAADGNLLATMADGTILVVRIGTTTYDSVTRAIQSLCENNVLGVVVNGAHHSELYSRYSYYHDYYYNPNDRSDKAAETSEVEPVNAS